MSNTACNYILWLFTVWCIKLLFWYLRVLDPLIVLGAENVVVHLKYSRYLVR